MSSSLLRRRKNDVIYAVAAAALRLGVALPRDWLPRAGDAIGRIAHALLAGARRQARENLALVHPHLDTPSRRHFIREVFRALGRNLTDTVALLDPSEDPARTLALDADSSDELTRALAEGRGVLYATCHLGPWERMAALLADRGFPITTVARESYDPRFHRLLYDKLRARRGVEVIYRGQPGAPAAIVRTLKRGRVLGLLLDLPGSIATSPVAWLGKASRMAPGAARLALRTRAPVVIGTPGPGSYPGAPLVVRIARLPTADLSPGHRGEAALSQRIADALSDRICRLPTHWPWMHPSFASELSAQRAPAPRLLGTDR